MDGAISAGPYMKDRGSNSLLSLLTRAIIPSRRPRIHELMETHLPYPQIPSWWGLGILEPSLLVPNKTSHFYFVTISYVDITQGFLVSHHSPHPKGHCMKRKTQHLHSLSTRIRDLDYLYPCTHMALMKLSSGSTDVQEELPLAG